VFGGTLGAAKLYSMPIKNLNIRSLEACLILPWVSYKHFTGHCFECHCEVFGRTLGVVKIYSMPMKNQNRRSLESMFGFTVGSQQTLHEALIEVPL
jgi:hypothetical protein